MKTVRIDLRNRLVPEHIRQLAPVILPHVQTTADLATAETDIFGMVPMMKAIFIGSDTTGIEDPLSIAEPMELYYTNGGSYKKEVYVENDLDIVSETYVIAPPPVYGMPFLRPGLTEPVSIVYVWTYKSDRLLNVKLNGEVHENFTYDQYGRLVEYNKPKDKLVTLSYKDKDTNVPTLTIMDNKV